MADDGTVVNVDDMKPQTLDSHCSDKPVRYVLEMNQGWFAKKGVKPGFQADRPPLRRRNEKGPRSGPCSSPRYRPRSQPKFLAAKSQFTSLSRKVSTNFGRRLR